MLQYNKQYIILQYNKQHIIPLENIKLDDVDDDGCEFL